MLISRTPHYHTAPRALLELDILLAEFFLHPADRLTIERPESATNHFARVRLWQGETLCGEVLGITHTSVLAQIQRVAGTRNRLVFDLRRSTMRLKPAGAPLPAHRPVRGTVVIQHRDGLCTIVMGGTYQQIHKGQS